jgi:monoamine oxidase
MVFDTQIVRIDHGGDEVTLTDADDGEWTADRIVFTAPMKILQDGDVEFEPGLPPGHVSALERANIWTGMKVFIEFSESFWPAWLTAKDEAGVDGQHLWYDASHGQDSDRHVLGLFTVGDMSAPYQAVDPGDELRDLVLSELDPITDGLASETYLQHISQNWAEEPFIRAAYLADTADTDISQDLGQNIGPRVFMAGCGYTREFDWSSVHTAVRSARDCVEEMFP